MSLQQLFNTRRCQPCKACGALLLGWRRWVFVRTTFALVTGLCRESFGEVLIEPRPEARKPLPPSPYRTLGLVGGAPLLLVEAAYRAMAKLYHPDVAGQQATARMQRINAAYEQLTRGSMGA
jgi:hypothetical protein